MSGKKIIRGLEEALEHAKRENMCPPSPSAPRESSKAVEASREVTPPIRVQLSRRKGWRLPNNTVKVSRPGRWGNPFIVTEKVKPGVVFGGAAHGYVAVPTVDDAVECFRLFLNERPDLVEEAQQSLRGKNLACWCRLDQPCHADVLLELANRPVCEALSVSDEHPEGRDLGLGGDSPASAAAQAETPFLTSPLALDGRNENG